MYNDDIEKINALQGIANTTAMIGFMHKRLVESGLTRSEALVLCQEFIKTLTSQNRGETDGERNC